MKSLRKCSAESELRGQSAIDLDGLARAVGILLGSEKQHLRAEFGRIGKTLQAGTVLEDKRAFGIQHAICHLGGEYTGGR